MAGLTSGPAEDSGCPALVRPCLLPTTQPIDLAAPGVSVDISATAAAGDTLVAAAMLSTWSYGFGAVDAAALLAEHGLATPRRHFLVMDELWRALRGAPGLVDHADALTRLNRSRGIASLMIDHPLPGRPGSPAHRGGCGQGPRVRGPGRDRRPRRAAPP